MSSWARSVEKSVDILLMNDVYIHTKKILYILVKVIMKHAPFYVCSAQITLSFPRKRCFSNVYSWSNYIGLEGNLAAIFFQIISKKQKKAWVVLSVSASIYLVQGSPMVQYITKQHEFERWILRNVLTSYAHTHDIQRQRRLTYCQLMDFVFWIMVLVSSYYQTDYALHVEIYVYTKC